MVFVFEENTLLDLPNKKKGRFVALARLIMIGAESGRMRLLLGEGEVVDEEGLLAPRWAFELNSLLCLVRRRRTIVVADDGDE